MKKNLVRRNSLLYFDLHGPLRKQKIWEVRTHTNSKVISSASFYFFEKKESRLKGRKGSMKMRSRKRKNIG